MIANELQGLRYAPAPAYYLISLSGFRFKIQSFRRHRFEIIDLTSDYKRIKASFEACLYLFIISYTSADATL